MSSLVPSLHEYDAQTSVADVEKLFQEYGREIWTAKAERSEGTAGITPRLWLCTLGVAASYGEVSPDGFSSAP